jgi:uncharacterized RDD family membrane protein YckC
MSWQTPDGDPPPESAAQPPDAAAPEPDAETARFPVAETPPSETPPPETPPSESTPPPPPFSDAAPPVEPEPPATTSDAQPPAGIISAAPVGWSGAPSDSPSGTPADGPVVPWSAPAAPVAAAAVGGAVDGVVIARTFPRVVAYFVDSLILGTIGVALSALLGLYDSDPDPVAIFGVAAVLVLVDLLYFIGLWTSGLQATLGMRLLKLRVLDAVTAGTLPLNDALLRWIALSGAVGILGLVPGLRAYIGPLGAIWVLILLVSTATNPLRQGLHDRWARSVVVQPAPGGSGLAVVTCLVLLVLIGVVLPIAGFAIYGDQIRDILVEIGNSV